MTEKPKTHEAPPKTPEAPEALVTMRHETARFVHRVAIGDEWFDVAIDGIASFPLRLVDAAELAGFRRVT